MKSITTLSLALMMALSLSACWKKKTETTEGDPKNVASMSSKTLLADNSDMKSDTKSDMKSDTTSSDMMKSDMMNSDMTKSDTASEKEDMTGTEKDKEKDKKDKDSAPADSAAADLASSSRDTRKMASLNIEGLSKKIGSSKDLGDIV